MMNVSANEKIYNWIVYILLIGLCIITLYPFIFVFMYSISDAAASGATAITFYPVKPTTENYQAVFSNNSIMRSFFITIARTVSGSILHIFVTGLAAYALSKRNLVFRNKILVFFIIPMYFSGGLLPYYVLITKIHLNNNFLLYIIPTVFGVFNMLILKVFFEQIPASLEESAKIDGANEFSVFFKIIIPSSMPVIATVLMFIGVTQWNSWFDALLFVTKSNLMPLQTILYKIILENQATTMEQIMRLSTKKSSVTPEAIKMTALIISTVPIVVIYPFLQKYFVKGMMIGAVKG